MGVIINPRTANPFLPGVSTLIKENMTADTHTGADAIHQFALVPAGMFPIGRKLRVAWAGSKNGTSNAATFNIRLGPLNTTSDTKLTTVGITLAASNQSASTLAEFYRTDATTIRVITSGAITPRTAGTLTAANMQDITLSAGVMDAAFYVTLSCSLTTEIYTNRLFYVEVF